MSLEDLDLEPPGTGEVRLEVVGCGVCHTDLHVIKGEVDFPTPCVLGHEVSGRVVETGAGVSRTSVGDAVVCSFVMPCQTCARCVAGHDDLCETFFSQNRLLGRLYDGRTRLGRADGAPVAMYSMAGFAEQVVVPASAVFRAPEGTDLAHAAILGCSLLTAYGAVRNVADLHPGQDVAVVASGGVGLAIVMLAKAFGADRIIAIDLDDEKLELAAQLGATHTVNAAAAPPVDAVRELTAGRGVDVAFEALGSAGTFATAVESVADGGRAVLVGIAPKGVTGSVEITRLVRRKLQVFGSYGGRPGTDMPELVRLVERGVLAPGALISREYALDDVPQAFSDLAAGQIRGRAIVRC